MRRSRESATASDCEGATQRARRRSCSITRPASLAPFARFFLAFTRTHEFSLLSFFFFLRRSSSSSVTTTTHLHGSRLVLRPRHTHVRGSLSPAAACALVCEFAAKPVKKLTSSIMSQGEKARQHAQLLVLMLAISLLISTRIADVVEAGRQPVTGESQVSLTFKHSSSRFSVY